jgi:chromosome segregation ATPase
METSAKGTFDQGSTELETLMTRISQLVSDTIKQEINLKGELDDKIENIASSTAILKKNNNKKIADLKTQLDQLKLQMLETGKTGESNQLLIGELRSLEANQEMQFKTLREEFGRNEQILAALVLSLENSKREMAEFRKQIDGIKKTIKTKESVIGEYKVRIDLLGEAASPPPNPQEKKANEQNSEQQTDRKSQKKMLKRLLKENPKASDQELAKQLGVDSSSISQLRKEFNM